MARTGENIYKRKDGRWEARILISGKYKSIYGKTYGEVREKRTQALVAALTAQKKQTTKDGLLKTIAENWLETIKNSVKESTFVRYSSLLRLHIVPYWQGWSIRDITTFQAEKYVLSLLTGSLSPKTAVDILILLKSIFKYAERVGFSMVCDFSQITMPKEKNTPMRVLNQREYRELTGFLLENTNFSKLGVLLSLCTGLRIGELCALKWENIDLKDRILQVKHTMQRIQNPSGDGGTKTKIVITEPKSAASVREIPIPKTLMPLLRKMKPDDPTAYFLSGSPGKFIEPRTLQKRFKTYIKSVGIADANYHATRHTFATRAVEIGFDVKSLSEILGHSNVQTTLGLYVHPSFELKRKYMDRVGLG